jgi:hypothetical protein
MDLEYTSAELIKVQQLTMLDWRYTYKIFLSSQWFITKFVEWEVAFCVVAKRKLVSHRVGIYALLSRRPARRKEAGGWRPLHRFTCQCATKLVADWLVYTVMPKNNTCIFCWTLQSSSYHIEWCSNRNWGNFSRISSNWIESSSNRICDTGLGFNRLCFDDMHIA